MALPTDIRPSSFRGVDFKSREVGFTSGRRLTTHEYPQKDEPYTEDHGRATRRWTLQAFLVRQSGESHADLQARKRKLIEACETKGAGKLVHPTDGEITVRCESVDVSESSDGIYYVELRLAFVESGAVFSVVEQQTPKVRGFADVVKSSIRTAYLVRRAVRATDDIARRALSGSIYQRMDALLQVVGRCGVGDMTAFRDAVRAIRDANTTMADDAEEFSDAWLDVIDGFESPVSPRAVAESLLPGLVASQAAAATGASNTLSQAALDNLADTDLLMATMAVASAGELAVAATYSAYEDAIAVRDQLDDLMDTVGTYTTDPDTWDALRDLRSAVSKVLTDEALDLPRVRGVHVVAPTTALELAYAIYGDAGRAEEIVDRNKIADPNAVTGDLQVLTE